MNFMVSNSKRFFALRSATVMLIHFLLSVVSEFQFPFPDWRIRPVQWRPSLSNPQGGTVS